MEIKDFKFTENGITIGYTGGGEPGPTPPGPTPTNVGISYDFSTKAALLCVDENTEPPRVDFTYSDSTYLYSEFMEGFSGYDGTMRVYFPIAQINISESTPLFGAFNDYRCEFSTIDNNYEMEILPSAFNVVGYENATHIINTKGQNNGMLDPAFFFKNMGVSEFNISLPNASLISADLFSFAGSGTEMFPVYLFLDFTTFKFSLGDLDENSDLYKFYSEVFGRDIISQMSYFIENNLGLEDIFQGFYNFTFSLPNCEILTTGFFAWSWLWNRNSVYLSQSIKCIQRTTFSNVDLYINYISDTLPQTESDKRVCNQCNLYVPSEMVGLYQGDSHWNHDTSVYAYDFTQSMPW